MKKILKTLIVVLVIFQTLFTTSPSFAAGAEVGENILIYTNKKIEGLEINYYGQDLTTYYTVYNKNNIEYVAYCIDYFKGGVTDERSYEVQITQEYVNKDSTDETKLGVWRAIINGYPFKSYEELKCADKYEAYAATKQAVWCMLYADRDVKFYTYSGDAGTRVYNAMEKIVKDAKASTQVPMDTEVHLTEGEWQIDEINNQFLSKKITLSCESEISRFSINLDGNIPVGTVTADLQNEELTTFKNCKEFKILVPLESLIENNSFTIDIEVKLDAYPMYLGEAPSSNLQNYVLTAGNGDLENVSNLIKYPENKTRLLIKKQDEEGKTLEGVKFNILDKNKNIVYEKVETNEDGVIQINNMIPGIYYIQEVESIEGYEINDELIEFSIDLDEEKEIIVENKKIPEEPEIPETPTPELPKLPRTGW